MNAGTSINELLVSLTEVQQVAAKWEDGPLVLLAGPGSGKTRVITARIARMLADSAAHKWRFASLTFTTAAADEMRSRILSYSPEAENRLFVGTFHSFACELLRQSGSNLGIKTDFRIYSTVDDRALLLNRAIKEHAILYDGDTKKVLPLIDRMNERLISPERSAKYVRDPDRGELFARIYAAYQRVLSNENALDFASMIHMAHRLLTEFPTIAERYRSVFRHLCVDEFQDTNAAQYAFLRAFAGSSYRNVFIVADDDQIIYQWNGASHKRLGEFIQDFSPTVLQMPTNFRCPSEVVALANKLVAHNALRSPGKEPLLSGKPLDDAEERVRLLSFVSDQEEADGIAKDLASRHKDNPRDAVVIARSKRILELMQHSLSAISIPSRIAQRRDNFASLPYQWLQNCLELADRRADEHALSKVIGAGNTLFHLEVDQEEVAAQAQSQNGDFMRAWLNEIDIEKIELLQRPLVTAALDHLVNQQDFRRFIAVVHSHWAAQHAALCEQHPSFDEDSTAWKGLVQEIDHAVGDSASLDSFLRELVLRSKEPPIRPEEVALLTIHGSKGKEFKHVYLVGLAEDILPSFQAKRRGDPSPEMEEERRNCFVAITRCRETLTLSYAQQYGGWAKDPSRFVAEMGMQIPIA